MSKLTAISLFSGCGGFDWGVTQAGVKIIWANDIDSYAASAYKSIFPNVPFKHEDVRNIEKFPEADILIGCYPCTGFSVAARRRWKDREERNLLNTEGNFLYKEFLRALEQTKPKYFFVENVTGMVSALSGWFFQQQLEGFKNLGYFPKMKLLRAPDYGVPQSRKRIFIVGIRNDVYKRFDYSYPAPTHGPGTSHNYISLRATIGSMDLWPTGEFSELPFHGHYLTRNRKRNWDDISYTIVANLSHVPLHPHGEPMKYVSKDNWILQGDFNRRLSWRECAKIQGLPDHIVPQGSLDNKYRVIGNAVPPAFGKALLEPIIEYENILIR
ncbi:MAG: DNA cytosine methyltransferase [Bacillota bacterium]